MEEETKKAIPSRQTLIVQLGLLLFLAMIGTALFFPTGSPARENARRSSCQSNLKQIMRALSQYAQDNDDRSPVVATSQTAYGWADALLPYLVAPQLYQCPSEINGPQSSTDATQPHCTDYWFNARLSHIALEKLSAPSKTIALGEGNDGTDATNARYHLLSIPQKWRTDYVSPLYRHLHSANFGFADGHVKSFNGDQWKNELDMKNGFTFRLNPKK